MNLLYSAFALFIVTLLLLTVGSSHTQSQAEPAVITQLVAGEPGPYHYLGRSVAVSGDTIVAGATGANGRAGAVHIFQWDGRAWTEHARLVAADAQPGDHFGGAVALDGDLVVVGARYKHNGAGAAYVFQRQGTTWVEQARLAAADSLPFDLFGHAVAISGRTIVVGARSANDPQNGRNAGAVYVFQQQNGRWVQQARLTAADGGPVDHFGHAVAVDGDLIVVGAFGHDDPQNGRNAGAAYVFHWNGRNWQQQARLTAAGGAANDAFAYAVALDGDTVAVGASQHDWGHREALGAVYVFQQEGATWRTQARLTPTDLPQFGGIFGDSVALSGDTIVAGGRWLDGFYRFQRRQGVWTEQARLDLDTTALGGRSATGEALALAGDVVVAGARTARNPATEAAGVVLVYRLDAAAEAAPSPRPTPVVTQPAAMAPPAIAKTPVSPGFSGHFLRASSPGEVSNDYILPVSREEPRADPRSDRIETSLHFWRVGQGGACPYPGTFPGYFDMRRQTAWLPGGRFLVLPGDGAVLVGEPCASTFRPLNGVFAEPITTVAAQSPDQGRLLLRGHASYWLYDPATVTARPLVHPEARDSNTYAWLPDGRHLAITASGDTGSALYLVDTVTGQATWTNLNVGGPAGFLHLSWLTTELAVVHQGGGGPLLVSLAGDAPQATAILPEIFGLDLHYPDEVVAFGALPDEESDSFFIFVAVSGAAAEGIYIFRSATGAVERLPYVRSTYLFAPGDRLISLHKFDWEKPDVLPTGPDLFQLYWITADGSQGRQLTVEGHTPRKRQDLSAVWLPHRDEIAFSSSQGVSLVSLPDGRLRHFWTLEAADDPFSLTVLPNLKTLIVQAHVAYQDVGPPEESLYAIPLP